MSQLGFFFDIAAQLITFILIVKYRFRLAEIFEKISLPTFWVFLISSVPFIIIEENINCGAIQCIPTLLPWTLIPLMIILAVMYYIIKKTKAESMKKILIWYCTFGVLFELLMGHSSGQFQALPPAWFVFMVFWVSLSYVYIAIIPLTIQLKKV